MVLPLFYDVHEYQVSRTTAVFPLFVRRHIAAEEQTYWVSPFFYSHTSPTYSTTFGFPLVFVPLYWDIRRGDNRTTAVLPLFYKWRRASYQSTLVVPFYYHQEGLRPDGTPDGTDHRFVGVVLPVYESAVKRPGDFMWRLLLGLVGGERIGHHRYLRLFWFFDVELEPAPKTQTAWYSKPAPAPRKMAARGLLPDRRRVSDYRSMPPTVRAASAATKDPCPSPRPAPGSRPWVATRRSGSPRRRSEDNLIER